MRGNLDKRNAFKFANVCLSGLTLDWLIVDIDRHEGSSAKFTYSSKCEVFSVGYLRKEKCCPWSITY